MNLKNIEIGPAAGNIQLLFRKMFEIFHKRLIQRFIQLCRESDVHRIITDSDDIEALRHFYASIGFRVTGVNYEMDRSP